MKEKIENLMQEAEMNLKDIYYKYDKIEEENSIKLRDILKSTSSSKTNFMYSVVLNEKVEKTEPNYIQGGLEWLMK